MSCGQERTILLVAEGDEFSIIDSWGGGWFVTAERLDDGTYELCINEVVGDGTTLPRFMTGPMAPSEGLDDVYEELVERMPEWLALAAEKGIKIDEAQVAQLVGYDGTGAAR